MIDQIKDIKYAKFSRLAAFLVDSLVFLSVWIISLFIFLNPTRGLGNLLVVVNSYLFLVIIWIFINGWLYSKFGGSLGKILCGLKVTHEDGSYLNFNDYFFREYVAKIFSAAVVFLGYFYIFYHPKAQAFHDMFAKTYVLKDGSYKPAISPIISLILFTLLLFMLMFKIGNEKLLSKINTHTQVLSAETEYQINQIQKWIQKFLPKITTFWC